MTMVSIAVKLEDLLIKTKSNRVHKLEKKPHASNDNCTII